MLLMFSSRRRVHSFTQCVTTHVGPLSQGQGLSSNGTTFGSNGSCSEGTTVHTTWPRSLCSTAVAQDSSRYVLLVMYIYRHVVSQKFDAFHACIRMSYMSIYVKVSCAESYMQGINAPHKYTCICLAVLTLLMHMIKVQCEYGIVFSVAMCPIFCCLGHMPLVQSDVTHEVDDTFTMSAVAFQKKGSIAGHAAPDTA